MKNDKTNPQRRADRGRWSAKRKAEIVVRILRGEDLDTLSRELGLKTSTLASWRDGFLAGGEANLKSRPADARDDEIRRLQAKVGELTMDNELLGEKIRLIEGTFAHPRSRRSRP